MKKKGIKKIFSVLLLIVVSFLIVGCKNNNEEEPPTNVTLLPTIEEKAKKDEVIYINMSQSGFIETMKVTNHISDSQFLNYQDYGYFNQTGNLNITNSKSKIIIKDDHALIPSLDPASSMFYTLSLNKEHYKNLLPFNIQPTYKLNNINVGYEELINATGEIELNYLFTSNNLSHEYFKNTYAAQVQIPINLNNAQIISSKGAMQKIIVGSEVTLIYMIMPGQTQEIKIKLDVTKFSFAGMQAVLQPLDIMALGGDFVNIDDYISGDITDLEENLDLLINEFSNANNQMLPIFKEMLPSLGPMFNYYSDSLTNELSQLVEGLEDPQLNQAYQALSSIISYNISHISQREWFQTKTNQIKDSTTLLSNYYDEILIELNKIINKMPEINQMSLYYSTLYDDFIEIINEINLIKKAASIFNDIDMDNILSNKEDLVEAFEQMISSNTVIKKNFQNLITNMYTFPNEFQKFIHIVKPLISFLDEIQHLKTYFNQLATRILMGIDNSWFTSAMSTQFQQLYDELVKVDETLESPGLIQGLDLAIEGLELINELQDLVNAYEIDEVTHMHQMDQLIYGFILMNEALSIPQVGQDISFYESFDTLKIVTEIIKNLPTTSFTYPPSFLSEDNLNPNSVQFVIKQRGF